jgi:hypothetical protein
MSFLNIAHSPSKFIIDGDIDTGRGQLGITANGTLQGVINDLWLLSSPYKPARYILDATGNVSIQLPIIGLLQTDASVGHHIMIHNISVFNITIQNSSLVNIYVIPPGLYTLLTAIGAPGNWDYTTLGGVSSVTLQSAYDNGNTIFESLNREVLIQDNAGYNPSILDIQAPAGNSLFKIGNSVGGVNTPYLASGISQILSPQSNTVYIGSNIGSYTSVLNEAGSLVLVTPNKREILSAPVVALGSASSSVNNLTLGGKLTVDSVSTSSIIINGLANTTYDIEVHLIINNALTIVTTRLQFTMVNGLISNVISPVYEESQIDTSLITVNPLYTAVSSGGLGVSVNIIGPDYLPAGLKTYDCAYIIYQMAITF